jgi:hypothetical protein
VTYTAEVNASGNFFGEDPAFVYPYTARIDFGGRTRRMLTPQVDGDCNSCHTQIGDEAALGRILLP